jgi:hypothetical protein
VFKRKANEYVEYIREVFPAVEAQLNPDKPRKGAFNISVQVSNVQCKAAPSSNLGSAP